MPKNILLTSFKTWLPHHKSNSSDDLLKEFAVLIAAKSPQSLTFLRQLPVDVQLASRRVITKIEELQPDVIICCGMAESRTQLSIESNATCGKAMLKTTVNLEKLAADSAETEISHDAGKYVCEGLYYQVLQYLNEHQLNSYCIFVHVPVLTPQNLSRVLSDFELIVQRLSCLSAF